MKAYVTIEEGRKFEDTLLEVAKHCELRDEEFERVSELQVNETAFFDHKKMRITRMR